LLLACALVDGISGLVAVERPSGIRNATVSMISCGEPSRPHGSARFAAVSISTAWSPDAPQALRIGVSMTTEAARTRAGRGGETARP
jgi:hypothetical protein